MGFTYLDKFTNLNTFVMQVAQRCSDNRGPTVCNFQLLAHVDSCHMRLSEGTCRQLVIVTTLSHIISSIR